MRAKEHIAAGVIATTATYLLVSNALGQTVTLEGVLLAAALGVPAGLTLDILEPAVHPCHRASCHSVAAAAGLIVLANQTMASPTISVQAKVWLTAFFAGVGSHYVLDATTAKGLPLIGLKFN